MSDRPPSHGSDEGTKARPSLRLVPGPAPQPLDAEQQQLVLSVQRLASQLVTELCGYVTPEERDELVAEANVAVTFAASRCDLGKGPFVSYVYPYICGAIFDRLKRERRHRSLMRAASIAARHFLAEEPEVETAEEEDDETEKHLKERAGRFLASMFAGLSAGHPNPEVELMDIESYQIAIAAVHEALESAGQGERDLYRLRYVEGRSTMEIAALRGVDERSIRRAHEKLIDKLRGLLEKRGITEAPRWR